MPYRLFEDERVKRKARELYVRERAQYEDIRRVLRADPYPSSGTTRIRRLEFDDGLTIFSYAVPSSRYTVVYTVREADPGEELGVVRVVALIDRGSERG